MARLIWPMLVSCLVVTLEQRWLGMAPRVRPIIKRNSPYHLSLLQTLDQIRKFSYLLGLNLANDGVIYAEVRFCPYLYVQKGLYVNQVVQTVIEGLSQVPQLKFNLILCMMRDFSESMNHRIILLAKDYLGKGVCAVDLVGDEKTHPNCEFEELFGFVREYDVPFTIHAGETDGARSVADAIRFGAGRIGHGARVMEDKYVLKRLLTRQIPLEICLTSDIDTGIYPSPKEHPVRQLMDAGIPIAICTDNRTILDTSLEDEYQLLRDIHGFTDEELLRCNLNATLASFATPGEKISLCRELLTGFAQYRAGSAAE